MIKHTYTVTVDVWYDNDPDTDFADETRQYSVLAGSKGEAEQKAEQRAERAFGEDWQQIVATAH